jgi:hypothetical protein
MSSPSAPATSPAASQVGFVVAVFAIGAILTAVVGYFGFTGQLGTGILGTEHGTPPAPTPPAACQGHGALGSFHFVIVAGPKGTLTFNGSSPGPCFAVAAGSTVLLEFQVAHDASAADSWVLIPGSGPIDQAPVFPGAGTSDSGRTTGLGPGQTQNYTFQANTPGQFRYVSEVSDHAAVGEWGAFNVTASALTVASTVAHPNPAASSGSALATTPGMGSRSEGSRG